MAHHIEGFNEETEDAAELIFPKGTFNVSKLRHLLR